MKRKWPNGEVSPCLIIIMKEINIEIFYCLKCFFIIYTKNIFKNIFPQCNVDINLLVVQMKGLHHLYYWTTFVVQILLLKSFHSSNAPSLQNRYLLVFSKGWMCPKNQPQNLFVCPTWESNQTHPVCKPDKHYPLIPEVIAV